MIWVNLLHIIICRMTSCSAFPKLFAQKQTPPPLAFFWKKNFFQVHTSHRHFVMDIKLTHSKSKWQFKMFPPSPVHIANNIFPPSASRGWIVLHEDMMNIQIVHDVTRANVVTSAQLLAYATQTTQRRALHDTYMLSTWGKSCCLWVRCRMLQEAGMWRP